MSPNLSSFAKSFERLLLYGLAVDLDCDVEESWAASGWP